MRLLMTTDTVGGVWTFTQELAGEFLRSGCDVLLVSFGGEPSASQQQSAEKLRKDGRFQYVASALPLEWMPQNECAYTAGEPLLLQLCQQFQPDALLLSQFCFGALPVAVPKLIVAHSDVLSWAAAVGKAPLVDDVWLRTYLSLVQSGLRGADVLIAPTRAALDTMAVYYGLPVQRGVIPNGRTIAPRIAEEPRRLQAITAGRLWDPAKNLHLLAGTRAPLPVLVAGEGNAADLAGSPFVLTGHLSQEDLVASFRASAIYICPSLYEPFGLAPLEAALCGCAVVAYDIPSLREVWGAAALYFRTADELAAVLVRLTESPELLRAAQDRAGERAKGYTAHRMAGGYLRTIQRAMLERKQEDARAA